MGGLHARFSDVHAFSVILKTCSMLCALCGLLHYSASSTLCRFDEYEIDSESYVDSMMYEIDSA